MGKTLSINQQPAGDVDPATRNPYPGLRPFNLREKHLFYGREGQSEKVLELLTKNRFVAVIGPSGSGKSSLVNCGIVPQLYGGYLYEAGSRWKIASMHPGYSPLESLSVSLTESFASEGKTPEQIESEINLNYALFTKKGLEISTIVKNIENYKKENILIVIDQFEELFRFTAGIDRKESDIDESLQLINLLIDALEQKKVPVYVIICIRSDFVGSCSNYQILTDYINLSHYLVPQMARDAYRSAILKPLSQTKARINPEVLQEILNHIGDKPDQLPVLQHLMMRLYNYWTSKGKSDQPISIYDYKTIGGLEGAISLHAEELYEQLTEKEKLTCKRMFQTITESGADNKGIRRPTSVNNILKISKKDKTEVMRVANLFRAQGNSFITPDIADELTHESVLDISHEAVMRNWKRLKGWIEEESDAEQLYLRLVEASALYQSGKSGPWRPPELIFAIKWRDKFQPNEVWASQYHPAYARSIRFLAVSEASYNEEEAEKEHARRREIRRAWWFAIVLAIAAVIAIGFMVNSLHLKSVADRSRNEAEIQRERAEENAMEAEKQKNLALQYADELEEQKAIVEANFLVASDERDVARITADRAVQQTEEVQQNLEEVSTDLITARQSTDAALEEKARIEQEQAETFRSNMVLLAQSLAVNSEEIKDDNELKALIAYQAYQFNQRYEGPENQAGIFQGLRLALEDMDVNYQVVYSGHTSSVRSLIFCPENKWLFSAGSDGRLIRWTLNGENPESEVIIRNNTINRIVAVSKDEKWLVCGAEGEGMQLFDLAAQNLKPKLLNAHQNRVRAIAFFNNNTEMLSSGTDNFILKWDLQTGKMQTFSTLKNPALSLAISADDRWVAAGTRDGKLLLYQTTGNEVPMELFNDPGNQILSILFREQDNLLICGDQRGNVRIWSMDSFQQIFRRKLHQARIIEIQMDPSGKYIATASTDGRVYVLDLQNLNQPSIEAANMDGFIYSVAFTDNGRHLVIGSNGTNSLVGQSALMTDLAGYICPNISRNMTRLEWRNYIGDEVPYEETCNQ